MQTHWAFGVQVLKGEANKVSCVEIWNVFLACFITQKTWTNFSVSCCLRATCCFPAGSQCGRMSHKETPRAPSFPHGALGFIVSLCSCVSKVVLVKPNFSQTNKQKKSPNFSHDLFYKQTMFPASCQSRASSVSFPKNVALPSWNHAEVPKNSRWMCSILPCLPVVVLDLFLPVQPQLGIWFIGGEQSAPDIL